MLSQTDILTNLFNILGAALKRRVIYGFMRDALVVPASTASKAHTVIAASTMPKANINRISIFI